MATTEPPARKVIALVKLNAVELKLTLTSKVLAKPFVDGVIRPFLVAFNKKAKATQVFANTPPLAAEDLERVELDGKVLANTGLILSPANDILKNDSVKIELFPPGSDPATAPDIEASDLPAKPVDVSDAAPPPAPAPAPTAKSPLADELAKAAISPPGEKPKAMASNTMPKCKYGLACRIIDPVVECTANRPIAEQHWAKFQHPCYWICEEGHPELGPPGMLCPLHPRFGMTGIMGRGAPCPEIMNGMIKPCTNMDPMHRKCFRHPEDDEEVEEVIDETPDDLDNAVLSDEATWINAADCGTVDEEAGMEAKMAAAEAMSNGDFEAAVSNYSKSLAAQPSALTFAKRAEALLKLGHPTAALADCKSAKELNPDSAKPYKVAAKALTKTGDWQGAYENLCIGNKIDEDEDSALLQKTLKAKVEKMKKIGEKRSKRADALFSILRLGECWASLELDVLNRGKGGGYGLEALKVWMEEDVVGLKARMGELGAQEDQMDSVFAACKALDPEWRAAAKAAATAPRNCAPPV